MTLEMWSWLAIFAIGGGLLVFTAWLFETWPSENPLDNRSQAHPATRSGPDEKEVSPRTSARRQGRSGSPVGVVTGAERD